MRSRSPKTSLPTLTKHPSDSDQCCRSRAVINTIATTTTTTTTVVIMSDDIGSTSSRSFCRGASMQNSFTDACCSMRLKADLTQPIEVLRAGKEPCKMTASRKPGPREGFDSTDSQNHEIQTPEGIDRTPWHPLTAEAPLPKQLF